MSDSPKDRLPAPYALIRKLCLAINELSPDLAAIERLRVLRVLSDAVMNELDKLEHATRQGD